MATKVKDSETLIIIGPCRLSYMNVFKARKNKSRNDELWFDAVLLIPKKPNEFCANPTEELAAIAAAIKAAAMRDIGTDAKGYIKPLLDGDTVPPGKDEAPHPGYWYLATRSPEQYPPILVIGDGSKATAEMGWVSGDWGRVMLQFFGYKMPKQGVSTSLRSVQFIYKDKPFGQSVDHAAAVSEFGTVQGAYIPGQSAPPNIEGSETQDEDAYNPFDDE